MQKQRNKRRTDSIRLKNRNRKPKCRIIRWRRVTRLLLDAIYSYSDSYYVEDTTRNRAPYLYQAPDLASENPEVDFKKGMHIINNLIGNWYYNGKLLLLKAANAGHAKAQFMLGHLNLNGSELWGYYEEPDLNLAETWLTEAVKNGLDGGELTAAQQDLQNLRERRERERKRAAKGEGKIKYFKRFGRIYRYCE